MKVLVVFAFAFVALAAAGVDRSKDWKADGRRLPGKPSTRVVKGDESVPHSRPWSAALWIFSGREMGTSSGTLIDERHILTSASVLWGAEGAITVVLGGHDLNIREPTQVRVSSSDYIIHELWLEDKNHNDIGLIRLPQPVTFNEYIQPIPVDNSSCSDGYVGRVADLSGWGAVKADDIIILIPDVLHNATLPVISNGECSEYYSHVEDTEICVDNTAGRGACLSDEGGPLVLDGKQIGITTRYRCGRHPTGFTRVCKYNDWIKRNTKN